MNPDGPFKYTPENFHQKFPPLLVNSAQAIAIYTVLSILARMKSELGMEAMLEYMDRYVAAIGKHNPRLKGAVRKAVSLINVQKIYVDGVS